jgi:hypothetical protein
MHGRPHPTESAALWVLLAVSAAACNGLLGFEEGQERPASSSTTSFTTSPTGAAGAGGGVGSEYCLDGVDNNGNQLADCEDPACADGFECAPAAPPGWLGVGWLHLGSEEPSCVDGVATELFDEADLQAPAAVCDCACEAPSPGCRAALECANGCGHVPLYFGWASLTCTSYHVGQQLQCEVDSLGLQATAGTCAESATVDRPAVTWPTGAWLCLMPNVGHCPGSDGCVATAETDGVGPCTARAGVHACPSDFPVQLEFWDGAVDDVRECDSSGCSCGATVGSQCGCTSSPCGIELLLNDDCTGSSYGVAEVPASGACIGTGAWSPPGERTFGVRLAGVTVTDPGSCAASGTAQPTGEVTASGIVTVCCAADTANSTDLARPAPVPFSAAVAEVSSMPSVSR